jgi:hypothetical protein
MALRVAAPDQWPFHFRAQPATLLSPRLPE